MRGSHEILRDIYKFFVNLLDEITIMKYYNKWSGFKIGDKYNFNKWAGFETLPFNK